MSDNSERGDCRQPRGSKKPRRNFNPDDVGRKGVVVLQKLEELMEAGTPPEVEFDNKNQPFGETGDMFLSYVGVLGREVPIWTEDWRSKELANLKREFWDKIKARFIISDGQEVASIKRIGEAARNFRYDIFESSLRRVLHTDAAWTLPPSLAQKYPQIGLEDWQRFVALRRTIEYQQRSNKAVDSRSLKMFASKKGKHGYQKEDLENYEATGEWPSREESWLDNRKDKDRTVKSSDIQEIAGKTAKFRAKKSKGSWHFEHNYDALVAALGNPVPIGHLRGKSKFQSPTSYFGRRSGHFSHSSTASQSKGSQDAYKDVVDTGSPIRADGSNSGVSVRDGSPPPSIAPVEVPPSLSRLGELTPLTAYDDNFRDLPLIDLHRIPRQCLLLASFANKKLRSTDNTIMVNVHPSLSQMPISIAFLDIFEFLTMTKVSLSVITTFMGFCYRQICDGDEVEKIVLIPPAACSPPTSIFDRILAVGNYLDSVPGGGMCLMPYNSGEHWVLSIIKPWEDTILYLNPLGGAGNIIHDDFQDLTSNALRRFKINHSRSTWKEVSNFESMPNLPPQPGNVECCYYVMRYMAEIITGTADLFSLMNRKSYCQVEIDQMITMWAEYIGSFIDPSMLM